MQPSRSLAYRCMRGPTMRSRHGTAKLAKLVSGPTPATSWKSNGSIPSRNTTACTCYAHLVTRSAKTQTNFRRDLPQSASLLFFCSYTSAMFSVPLSLSPFLLSTNFHEYRIFSRYFHSRKEGGPRRNSYDTFDHVRRLPQMGSMSRHCDPLQATEMHRLTPLSARLPSSVRSSMLLGPSISSPLSLSLSPAHGSSSLYRLFHVPRPTAALAPSINAYVRDTMYPAVL